MAIDFQRVFERVPGNFLLLLPDGDFTIVGASDAYLRATFTERDAVVGRALFDAFPDNPADPTADGVANLRASLQRVLERREADRMPTQKYDVRRPESLGGGFVERFWAPVNAPVLGEDGRVELIIHRVENVTDTRRAEEEQRVRAAAESEKLRRIYHAALSNTPDLVYVFDLQHRFIYANEALLKMWGRTAEESVGRTCLDLGYEPWHAAMHDREIEQVVATRAPIRGEVPFTGTEGRRIYDYIFVPVVGPGGDVVAVAGTTRDVTERKAAEQAIGEQAERLREADRAKDEFLATLSHELRNPLAPLRNSLYLLRLGPQAAANPAPIHEMMERQLNHLVRLVDDLLEMSRISRGTLELRRELVEVGAVIRNAVETSSPLIKEGGHDLQVTTPYGALWVDGDPVRLAQILSNLLNNAAKYIEAGGQIEIGAVREGDSVAIRVRDDGPGIEPEMLPRLFDMFTRGARATRSGQNGLGIGLALARRLAQMHGGTLSVKNGERGGAEFTLRLALVQAHEAPASAPATDGPGFDGLRVLVIDDNRDAGESLAMILESLGAAVSVAHDGPGGLAAFPGHEPDVVLLDIGMPGMDGYEVARALRQRHPGSSAVIVALTGWGQDEDRRRAREAGFDHHLVKPVDILELRALLATLKVEVAGD